MNSYITKHPGIITTEMREKLLGQKGCVLWLTGLSGSGKSTIAYNLEEKLHKSGIHTYVLDGDSIRHGLNKDLGFSPEDRKENIRRVAEMASLFANAGLVTIVSFISPFAQDRQMAREIISKGRLIEVYVKASLSVCEQRDPKGIYIKARKGEINDFTGISSPYEIPISPDIVLDTEKLSIQQSVQRVVVYLKKKEFVVN